MRQAGPRIFTFWDFHDSIPADAAHLSNLDIDKRILSMVEKAPELVTVVPRGLSPYGYPIREIIIADPRPGPKYHLAWHLDPHASDEREALVAGFAYGDMLLANPRSHLRNRAVHLLASSPDDRARIEWMARQRFIQKSGGIYNVLRNPDILAQAGWTLDDLTSAMDNLSSPGFRAVDAMLNSIFQQVVAADDGSRFVAFVSGHNMLAGDGVTLNLGAPSMAAGARVARLLERVPGELGLTMSVVYSESAPVRRYPGSRGTYTPDFATERKALDPTVKVGASDVERAHYLESQYLPGSQQLLTLATETPMMLLMFKPYILGLPSIDRDEIRMELNVPVRRVPERLKALGRLAAGSFASEPEFQSSLRILAMRAEDPIPWGESNVFHAGLADQWQDRLMQDVQRAMFCIRDLSGAIQIGSAVYQLAGAGAVRPLEWASALIHAQTTMNELIKAVDGVVDIDNVSTQENATILAANTEALFASGLGLPFSLDGETFGLSR